MRKPHLAVAVVAFSAVLLCATTSSAATPEPVSAPSAAEAKPVEAPKAGTPHHAIIEALKLIRAGNFDGFIKKWCHKGKLCPTGQAISSLKRYNLPAMKRLASKCLKAGDTLEVTRVNGDPAKDSEVKIFIVCDPRGMPRPFTLSNTEGGAWKHIRI